MSAARIREAAKVLRDAAENATPGTWFVDGFGRDGYQVNGAGTVFADERALHNDAAYIALMAPPVALALADWLDSIAERDESGNDLHWPHPEDARHALTLANTILGDRA
jgi:hypothetical protein